MISIRKPHIVRNQLREIIRREPDTIRATVAQGILHYSGDRPEGLLRDLVRCAGDACLPRGLADYIDHHAFYDRYHREIDILRHEVEEKFGESVSMGSDVKKSLALFGFVETAYKMAINDLDIDL